MIPIRTTHEIDAIARAGAVVARTLAALLDAARPGVTTASLDALSADLLRKEGAAGLFPGFVQGGAPPFPGTICTCVNDGVTHGVPGPRALAAGDIITIDLGASLDGWCADASRAAIVGDALAGTIDARSILAGRRRLLAAAHDTTAAAIAAMRPGGRWSDAADAAWRTARKLGVRLVAGYAGHGVGRALHETPRAPMFPGPKEDFTLWPGMVLTVEPIVVAPGGDSPGAGVEVVLRDDAWTVATADGADACQIEHTVAVTIDGARVLTPAP